MDEIAITLRLDGSISKVIERLATEAGFETSAYVLRLARLHAAQSGLMSEEESERILVTDSLLLRAVAKARELDRAGEFDAHFTLKVLKALFADTAFMADYERAIGGDAMARGNPLKASLNMNLGWHIKSAVGADPAKESPRRAQVRGLPIQSYTLLKKTP